ncbi:hypothetical protein AVL59_36865 [Streptomyces griseochromogenes]|uniref:Uncharacterized protein n=1 Tax=Streptomyces griseochromogenes TaxID=68214 RepID=A0A1B1B6F9_9ACTN|nr:hypothetical protein AVL59_36865 [Streptomyces griseochromogenes]
MRFERARLGRRTAPVLAAAGLDAAPGTACLNLHTPGFHGPLTPSARDRSPARPGSSSRTVSAVAVTTPTPTGTGKRAEPVG